MSTDSPPLTSERPAPTLWRLFYAWIMVGCQSFGGGGATLALIHRYFVHRFGWVEEAEFTVDWAVCQLTPGINLLALAARIGARIGGRCGSPAAGVVCSMAALLLPSAAITVAITGGFTHYAGHRAVQSALSALIPATVGLGLLTAWKMGRPIIASSRETGAAGGVACALIMTLGGAAMLLPDVPIIAVLIAGGAAGALFNVIRRPNPQQGDVK